MRLLFRLRINCACWYESIINIKFENGSNLTSIGENAFAYCRNLTCIELPNSLRSIDSYSFSFCNSLTTIILPEGITYLGDDAFSCSGIKSIVIPKSVVTIGRSVFDYYDKINTVYYTGTVEDWNKISIEEYNDKLTSSIIYYYSESQPTTSGNYWHYVDGEVVIW